MTSVDVSVSSALTPEQAWSLASDLHRFDEWLTIFGGWKSPLPDEIGRGTTVSSLIKVRGVRNTIHWEVTGWEPPRQIELQGCGRGGVKIALTMTVIDDQPGSTFHLLAELSGPLLGGPMGRLVANVLRGDVNRSVQNLAALSTEPAAKSPRARSRRGS